MQQSQIPGDLTVRTHLTDPIDRGEECRMMNDGQYWIFTPSELLDMMANPKRVFPKPCGRCTDRQGVILRKVEGLYEPGLWPDEAKRNEIVKELRDHFRDKGWY